MRDYDVFKKWLDEILGVPSKVKHHLIKEFKGMYTNKKPKRVMNINGVSPNKIEIIFLIYCYSVSSLI